MTAEIPIIVRNLETEQRLATEKASLDRIRVKNRRKRYLDLHPEYFGPQLELAGVQLSCGCQRVGVDFPRSPAL